MNNEKKNVPDVWGSGRKLPDNWGKSNIDGSSGSPWSANKKTLPTQGNLKSPVWGNSENAKNADSIPDKNKTTISQNSLNESVQSVDSENESQLFEGIFDEGQEKCDLGENANCLSDSVPVENNDEVSESAPLIDNHLVAEENVSENLKYENDDLLQGNGNVQKSFVNIDFGNDDSDIKSYLSKAREAIKKGDWSSAKDYCQFAIKIDSHNPLPYLYLVLSFEKLNSIEQLGNIAKKDGLVRNHNYSTALSYSNDSQKVLLSNYNMQSIYNYYKLQESNFIDDRERFILSTDLYRRIYLFMNSEVFPDKSHEKGLEYLYYLSRSALISAKCFSEFDHVSGMFKQISEYSDSLEMAEQCYEVYSQSIRTLIDSDDTTIEEIEDALSDLSKANGLTSAEILVQECQEKLEILRNEEKDLYYNELYERSQKRSKLIRNTFFGFVGIIVVLFAAKVVVTEISLIKDSSNKSQNNADVIVESTPDTDFVETTLVTSKATEKAETIQTTVFTDKINKKTGSTIAEDEYSYDEISSMFTEFLSANADPNRGYEYYSNSELKYALIDLNNDDRQELVISNGENEDGLPYVESIYSINNGKLSMIWAGDIRFCDWLCEGNYICSHYSLNEGNGFSIYRISSNEALEEIDDVEINYESGSRRILYNGVEISETEYNSISEKYKAVYFETKPLQLTAFTTSSTLIDAAKKAIYAHLDEKFYDEKTKQCFFDREAKYAMYDIDNNGVDELFITYYVDSGDVMSDLYVYENGEYLKKYSFNEAKICLSDDLILQNIYGGGIGTWIYTLVNGEVLQKDEFDDMPDAYYHNDLVVSEYEYNSIYSEYEKKDWIYLTHSSKYISELIDMSAYTDTSAKYTTYDTSAAGSDFSFISQPYSAKVITERDPLNLRAAPSSTGEVIIKMPKGSMVNLWGTDGKWDYLSYTENGITYYGYASSDYIGFT